MSFKKILKLSCGIIFCLFQIKMLAQCFPTTVETCLAPNNPNCTISPSIIASCTNGDLNRNFTGGSDGLINSGTYYAPDSEIKGSGEVPASNDVTFQAGHGITLKTGFVAAVNSVFTAEIDPVIQNFNPIALTVTNYDDSGNASFNHEDLSHDYNFELPVKSPVALCSNYQTNYKANKENLYFNSVFGPRYLSNDFDFHQGSDFVDRELVEDPPAPVYQDIVCMCEGTVVEKDLAGGTVKIRCKDNFNKPQGIGQGSGAWPKEYIGSPGTCENHYINIAYRHLASIESCIEVGKLIAKGDKIGVMGNTGATFKHLHLSVQRKQGTNTFKNVHPMRLLRPGQVHLLKTLDNSAVKIYQLDTYHSGDSEAVFRFVFDYDHIAIRYLRFSHGADKLLYDFEAVSAGECSTGRDKENPNCIDGLELYPYPFNRGTCAYGRYLDNIENMPATFPASPLYNGGNYYPLKQSAPFDAPDYVLDVVVDLTKFSGITNSASFSNLNIRVVDIYGKGVNAGP